MIRTIRTAAALGALAACLTGAAASAQEQADGTVKATHGAWQIRCVESDKVCVMTQVGKDSAGKEVLELQIRKLTGAKTPNGQPIPAAMQVITPLGVLLPAGVRIQIDAKKERAAPYETCTQVGCVVRQPLSGDFVGELKAGGNAKVKIVAVPQSEVGVTISLSGFTKAFDSL